MYKCVFIVFVIYSQIFCPADAKMEFIIHGKPVGSHQIPFIVSIQHKSYDFHFCGGNLITWRFVLTAAHCVTSIKDNIYYKVKNPFSIVIQAGDIRVAGYGSLSRQYRYPVKIIVHEYYQPSIVTNDIALIKVGRPFVQIPQINIIKMATKTPDDYTKCYVAGWGTTDMKDLPKFILLKADVEIKNRNKCNSRGSYHGSLPNNTICAGAIGDRPLNAQHVQDACQGDSGGPLLCNNDELAGVVSFGIGCGQARFPGVYTDVSKFQNWINSNIVRELIKSGAFTRHKHFILNIVWLSIFVTWYMA